MRTGITGGIGSGKSYVCRLLMQQGISVYDCDSQAKRLMTDSPTLRQQLSELIGPQTFIPSTDSDDRQTHYLLNKPVVARFLMSSPEHAQAIDDIVHPAVISDFLQSGIEWVESALLFEARMERHLDRVVVVTAPEEVRIARIMARDGITRQQALEWIGRQLPQEELIGRADFVIVNDGQAPLMPQIEMLTKQNTELLTTIINQKQ